MKTILEALYDGDIFLVELIVPPKPGIPSTQPKDIRPQGSLARETAS